MALAQAWRAGWRIMALLTLVVTVVGTIGYVVIEGWGWWDAFYMTIITITTVGYGEVHPLSRAGEAFTVVIILAGVGTFFYGFTQFTALIANPAGIFGVYSYREVFEFERFWGIGTGRGFALGAMYAAYDKTKTPREIAEIGVKAGCEFDKNSGGPVRVHTIKLKH